MTETHLPKPEAAALCGVSEDTLRRDQRRGKLPNTEERDGRTFYAIADLVAAGRLDPLRVEAAPELAGRSRAERDLAQARTELAVLRAEVEAARTLQARSDEEITFLRLMLRASEAA